MKKCTRCDKELDDSKFNSFKRRGKIVKYNECAVCMNTRHVAKMAHLKLKCINYLGGKCQICGYNKNQKALEFHHKDPTQKEYGLSSRKQLDFEKMKSELDKCMLLCSNCHREIHDQLWRNTNTVDWNLYSEMINYEKWPDLKKETNEKLRPPKPKRLCQDCGITISGLNRCEKCNQIASEKIKWPSDDELRKMVWETPRTILAQKLGVSDKAISKRLNKHDIKQPTRGYWSKSKK